MQSQSAASYSPAQAYERLLAEKKLRLDASQRNAMLRLEQLSDRLRMTPARGWLARQLFARQLFAHRPAPARSIYFWGDVGRGKSMLMDLFFHHTPIQDKTRLHFHAFMQRIHASLHQERKNEAPDPLARAAQETAASVGRLLCLDELQVTDVADAMILSRLFTLMMEAGVTFVITSNRAPDDLYQGGLQREQFLAFVALVRQEMDVIRLDSREDYRLAQVRAHETLYFSPLNAVNEARAEHLLRALTHGMPPAPATLALAGRAFEIRESYDQTACFGFSELCESARGGADYLAISARFRTVFLRRIPQMREADRNAARRFVTLIDALYDARALLLCTAEAPPEALYPAGDGSFEFARTVSRLREMQSEAWLAQGLR